MIFNFAMDETQCLGRRPVKRGAHSLPFVLRLLTWLVVGVEVSLPCNAQVWAGMRVLMAESGPPGGGGGGPVETPREVKVNRTVPEVTPPSGVLEFSESPTEEELYRARVFEEPLVPAGRSTPAENKDLATALLAFAHRGQIDDVSALTGFLETHPETVWRFSLLFNLGVTYRYTGYYSQALTTWEEAWNAGKAITEPRGQVLASLAVGELLELNARLGRFDRLQTLLEEIKDRTISGPATVKIDGARQGLALMLNEPGRAFLCGPMALLRVAASTGANVNADRLREAQSTQRGLSLAQVSTLANEAGMSFQMARRRAGASVMFPAVVHWKSGHFAAVIREQDGLLLVEDPTFGTEVWMTRRALDTEASGYFVVPAGPLPEGWEAVSSEEGGTVWGKGTTNGSDTKATKPSDAKEPCPPSAAMAQYSYHLLLASLNIVDTPVGYSPPRGPSVQFTVTYNQKEANQPGNFPYSNLGPKWTFQWLSYIKDNPSNQLAAADYYVQGGGTEAHSGFNTNTQSYAIHPESHATLVRTSISPISYERRLPDGSRQVFTLPDGAVGTSRKVFLTQLIDPVGNTVSFTYDGSYRLVAVTDALGQVTTVTYGLGSDVLKITNVEDPFGRDATFDYTQIGTNWFLTKITDVYGITSEFTYSTNDFIDTLTTPYGTSRFTTGPVGSGPGRTYWLEATDPQGARERVEYVDNGSTLGLPAETGPTNMFNGGFLVYRNTFYWDKKAMQDYPTNYLKARIFHWLHNPDITAANIKENEKRPLEGRVYYNYPGQTNAGSAAYIGTNAQPSAIGRVMDDGSSQVTKFEYNPLGMTTKVTDPVGRISTFTYDTNLVDLLEVRQQIGTNVSNTELLSKFTYSTNHLPLTAVDAAGQTNRMGYNGFGQLTALTNALNEVVTLAYDTNGYVTNITGAVSGATTGFTYDGYGRVRTVTDSEGYTVTTDYDDLDRPTKITYPDGTYDQIVYQWLDPVLTKDRRGHWSSKSYDALRRVQRVRDALGRLTSFEWCGCGSLESLTDPMGRTTTWNRDLEGRVTAKIYPDTTQLGYQYETNTSRLKSFTDALGQRTSYTYFRDDNLRQVSYTNAAVATPTVSFTYDTNYNRMLTLVDGVGTNTYSYYAVTNTQLGAGKLQSVDGPWSNDTIAYSYDELGRVTTRSINSVAVKMTYDALGRVTAVTNALGSFTTGYYGTTSRPGTNTYPNGQTTILSYYGTNLDQRLQTIWHQNSSTATISKFDYSYDADGQIATWTQQADAGTPTVWAPSYDPVDQLLGVTVRSNTVAGTILKQFVYGYDTAGNRTSEGIHVPGSASTVTAANHNEANQLTNVAAGGMARFLGSLNELGTVTVAGDAAVVDSRTTNFVAEVSISTGTNTVPVVATDYSSNSQTNNYQLVVSSGGVSRTLSYDLNGNLISNVTATLTATYEWDAVNRLVAINAGTNRSEFTYDGSGRRTQIVEKQNGSVVSTRKFLWCGTELCEERDSGGGTVNRRFVGQGEQISGTNYFFTRDHLGSVREMTDSSQTVRARYDYDPYGRRTKVTGDLDADFGFTGHYTHSTSGLCLTLYRAYDPETARWLSKDPIEEQGGLNLYAYVSNDPVNNTDPLGLYGSSLNTPEGVGVMAWLAEAGGAARAGGAMLALMEEARQFGAYLGGDCNALDPGKILSEAAKGALIGAITGPIFGAVFKATAAILRNSFGIAKEVKGILPGLKLEGKIGKLTQHAPDWGLGTKGYVPAGAGNQVAKIVEAIHRRATIVKQGMWRGGVDDAFFIATASILL